MPQNDNGHYDNGSYCLQRYGFSLITQRKTGKTSSRAFFCGLFHPFPVNGIGLIVLDNVEVLVADDFAGRGRIIRVYLQEKQTRQLEETEAAGNQQRKISNKFRHAQIFWNKFIRKQMILSYTHYFISVHSIFDKILDSADLLHPLAVGGIGLAILDDVEVLVLSVQQSEHPEGDTVLVSYFRIVNSQIAILYIFDLVEGFALAANFKKVFPVN